MRINNVFTAISLCSLSLNAFSGGVIEDNFHIPWTKVITLSAGPAFANKDGRPQTVTLYNQSTISATTNTFDPYRVDNTMVFGSLVFALQQDLGCGVLGQWGVELAGAGDADLGGDLLVSGLPSGSAYSYHMNHGRVALKGKLVGDPKYMLVQPYLSASVGAAFNHSFAYQTQPALNSSIAPNYYDDNTELAFAWSVGTGLQMNLDRNWQIGAGYEFLDWGKSRIGQALGSEWTNQGPKLSRLYTHQLVFSLSFMC